jgi:GntR family transcriptional regulator/MocR family aminotransferase
MPRPSNFPAFDGIRLDGEGPLHLKLSEGLRRLLVSGQVQQGARLPSTRELSARLGISRNTVQAAYDELSAQGYLEAQVGSGTRVCQDLPDRFLCAEPQAMRVVGEGATAASRATTPARYIPSLGPSPARSRSPKAFRLATPALDQFPYPVWLRAQADAAQRQPHRLLDFDGSHSFEPLRRELAAYLGVARGVVCSPAQVLIVPGAQTAIDLICRVLLEPGDSALIEDPCYPGALGALRLSNVEAVPVPVDQHGLCVSEGEMMCRDARLAYVTPSHQFPLGVTLTPERRAELLAWAERNDAFIVEDDFGCEFRYDGRPLPAIQGQARSERVLYVGTFSNVTFPGLRIGYLVVPESLLGLFEDARRLLGAFVPTLMQATLAEFMAEGHFAGHIRRMRVVYQERRDALLAALRPHAEWLTPHNAQSGTHLVCWLPSGLSDVAATAFSLERGVEVRPLSSYRIRESDEGGLVLGYGCVHEQEIARSAERLVVALRDGFARSPRRSVS